MRDREGDGYVVHDGRPGSAPDRDGALTTRTVRETVDVVRPYAGGPLLDFLRRHLVAGVETGSVVDVDGRPEARYARTVRLPHGPATVRLTWAAGSLTAEVDADPRDHADGLRRLRHLADADLDPALVDGHLGADPQLGELVRQTPGLRVPGVVDPAEMLFRTVLGQQVSLAAARASAATLTERYGEPAPSGGPGLRFLFPTPETLAAVDPGTLPMPRSRARALVGAAQRIMAGRLDLSETVDPVVVREELLACPGIGPWTADYVLMRARHAPDVLLTGDLVIARELAARSVGDPAAWSPYRSYAGMHLWHDFLSRTPG